MEVKLLYPTKDLETVEVGIITMKVVKLLSNQNLIMDGTLIYELVASVCKNANVEQVKEISLIDAHRVMLSAWQQTHGSNVYLSKQYCECGKLAMIMHQLDQSYEPKPIFESTQEIECIDPDQLKARKYRVKLRSIPLSLQANLLRATAEGKEEEAAEHLIWCRIVEIDGKVDFNRDNTPLKLYNQVSKFCESDTEEVMGMLMKEVKCEKCEEPVNSVISWTDSTFLQGE